MKYLTLVPAVLAFCSGAVCAQGATGAAKPDGEVSSYPEFPAADTDKDGLLSIAELQAALPDVKIVDKNADGFVNQSEAEAAIEGLAFESEGYTGGSSLVSEGEYGLIVSSLEGELNSTRAGKDTN